MFKENFIKLCNQKGESPSYVCNKVGLSAATFSCWTEESVPRKATLMRIADYFGITVDDLLAETTETKKSPSVSEEDLKVALFGGEKDIPDEVWQEVKDFAAYAKAKYGNKNKT